MDILKKKTYIRAHRNANMRISGHLIAKVLQASEANECGKNAIFDRKDIIYTYFGNSLSNRMIFVSRKKMYTGILQPTCFVML